MSNRKRTERIYVWVYPDEKDKIIENSSTMGAGVFLRELGLQHHIEEVQHFFNLAPELQTSIQEANGLIRDIGYNLNQVARALNSINNQPLNFQFLPEFTKLLENCSRIEKKQNEIIASQIRIEERINKGLSEWSSSCT
jgi:hypothetical protein